MSKDFCDSKAFSIHNKLRNISFEKAIKEIKQKLLKSSKDDILEAL